MIAMAHVELENDDDIYFVLHGGWSSMVRGVSQQELHSYLEKSYKITIRTGHVAWRTIYFHQDYIPPISGVEYRSDALKYIHPVGRKEIQWPPSGSIDDLMELDQGLVYLDKFGFGM